SQRSSVGSIERLFIYAASSLRRSASIERIPPAVITMPLVSRRSFGATVGDSPDGTGGGRAAARTSGSSVAEIEQVPQEPAALPPPRRLRPAVPPTIPWIRIPAAGVG